MNKAASYRNKAVVMEKMAAFSLYLDEGMAAVKRMYPQYVDFVRHNSNKTRTQVKQELLHTLPA
ncbi:MAG TPA: hypothetical protein VGM31_14860 [Puia sp.]|jgi:hypothetical protein